MRESGAELLGLHTAELCTVLPAQARALQNTRNQNSMRHVSRFVLNRPNIPNLALEASFGEMDEEWKYALTHGLFDNALSPAWIM
jgi:hypothetical protein